MPHFRHIWIDKVDYMKSKVINKDKFDRDCQLFMVENRKTPGGLAVFNWLQQLIATLALL